MPTYDQIESLQTQCYIHRKTGWQIADFQTLKFNDQECLFLVSFEKFENSIHIDNSPKTCVIDYDVNVTWR